MRKQVFIGAIVAFGILMISSTAGHAALLISGAGQWGSFSGSLDYGYNNSLSVYELAVSLTNTSPVENGGQMTAFVFNNPSGLITGVTHYWTDSNLGILGSAPSSARLATSATSGTYSLNNPVLAGPYGDFDMGAGLGGSFLAGGNPNPGVAIGSTANFVFRFSGTGLDQLTELAFWEALADPQGNGDRPPQSFVVRFRGFDDEESDMVPGQVVPEPATVLLLGGGLAGFLLKRRRF